jgi:hypothetical protein
MKHFLSTTKLYFDSLNTLPIEELYLLFVQMDFLEFLNIGLTL